MEFMIRNAKQEDLQGLYDISALTFVGLAPGKENYEALMGWIDGHGASKGRLEIIQISGKLMNDAYELTGTRAYPEDLNIVSLRNVNTFKLAIPRFDVGGRWFDDIVDNNRPEEEYEDY